MTTDEENQNAHDALVRGMVRRGLEHATDDQLRAECERRKLDFADYEYNAECGCGYYETFDTAAQRDAADDQHQAVCPSGVETLARERDEWKRRAEAAEGEVAKWREAKLQRIASGIERISMGVRESGPGIGSHPPDIHKPEPDHSHYVDPLDLLCEDA